MSLVIAGAVSNSKFRNTVGEPDRLLELQRYAKAAIAKDRHITLRLSSADLAGIQTKAIEEGILD